LQLAHHPWQLAQAQTRFTGFEAKLWQHRPLQALYPMVYLDAMMVKCRDNGHLINKAVSVHPRHSLP